MSNIRPWMIIVAALLAGVAAVVAAARWLGQQASLATRPVVVAARDLGLGTRLRPDMLQVAQWPADVGLKEPFARTEALEGRVLNADVVRGEPVLSARLAPPGEKGGLSAVLDEGRRAITVHVNEIVGVAGFALPGNYVDVMVNTPDDQNRPVSKIVLQRILVLAVAQDASTGDTKPRVVNAVTLEVTPEQAERIDLARAVGALSLVLRSQGDKGNPATPGARKTDLLQAEAARPRPVAVQERTATVGGPAVVVRRPPVAVPPPRPHEPQVEVIRGVARSMEPGATASAR